MSNGAKKQCCGCRNFFEKYRPKKHTLFQLRPWRKQRSSAGRFVPMATSKQEKNLANNRANHSLLLVHGYIRTIRGALSQQVIVPDDVTTLCLKFYFSPLNSLILTDEDVDSLFELLSKKISVHRLNASKLLFRRSRDGGLQSTMYEKLSNNGPYLFIMKSSDNYVFGGYCAINIDEKDSQKYLNDKDAFIFVLNGATDQQPAMFMTKNCAGKDAIYHGGDYWIIFGPSHCADVVIYNNHKSDCESKDVDMFLGSERQMHACLSAKNNAAMRYEVTVNQSLVGTKSHYWFGLCELEVFQIPESQ